MTKLFDAVNKAGSIALISHINPDGDTVGSALGLRLALLSMGKKVGIFCEHIIPHSFYDLPGVSEYKTAFDGDYDMYIAVDCGDGFRMGGTNLAIYEKKAVTANIDHHFTNPRYANINWVKNSSSTSEIVYEIITGELNLPVTLDIATCLYVGIITDTANFMHNNTTPETHRIAAKLIELGVDYDKLAYRHIKCRTLPKTRLLMRGLQSMRLFHENKIAVMVLLTEDFEACGCILSDTEGLVEFANNIEGVKAGLAVSQQANPNSYKVSFRSNGEVDVALSASSFGGGGHKRAAGCVLCGALEDVIDKLVKSCADQFPF